MPCQHRTYIRVESLIDCLYGIFVGGDPIVLELELFSGFLAGLVLSHSHHPVYFMSEGSANLPTQALYVLMIPCQVLDLEQPEVVKNECEAVESAEPDLHIAVFSHWHVRLEDVEITLVLILHVSEVN